MSTDNPSYQAVQERIEQEPVTPPDPDPFKENVKANNKARAAAYAQAVADMKEAFPVEWKEFYKARLEARGLTYVVRLSAEERAAKAKAEALAKIVGLIEENGILPSDLAQFGE